MNPIKLLTTADALAAQPAIDWQLDKIAAIASVGLVYGQPGAKKTYAMLDLAVCTATGQDWLGFPVRQGPVLLVDEESGPRRLLRRMGEVVRGHLADAALPLFATALEGFNFWLPNPGTGRKELEDAICQTQARLVIIDALADVMLGGDENTVKDTQRVFYALRHVAEGTGATILLIHHSLKNGNGYRGSSAINGALDFAVEVESKNGDALVKFETTKARDGEPVKWAGDCHWLPNEFWMTKTQAANGNTHKYTKAQRLCIACMQRHGDSATMQLLEQETGYTNGTLRNALADLMRAGILTSSGTGVIGAPVTYSIDILELAGNPL